MTHFVGCVTIAIKTLNAGRPQPPVSPAPWLYDLLRTLLLGGPCEPFPLCLCAPSRVLLLCCLMASLLLAAPDAQAGTWSLTISGSVSATATGKKAKTWTAPTTPATNSATIPSLSNGQGTGVGGTSNAAASLSATITGTWVPDPTLPSDPAPASVIVTETSTASASDTSTDANGNATPAVAGTADDGLGQSDPQSTSGSNVGTVSGTKYAVNPGGGSSGSFTVTIAPSSGASATAGPNGTNPNGTSFVGTGTCTASVGPITVSTTTPTVAITGTYNPAKGDYRVLTGQQITGTLSGTIGTVTSYTWTQPSATCFKTYNEKATSNQLIPLGPTDLSGPAAGSTTVAPLAFYDSTAENLTVTCIVNLTAPDGKTNLGLTVNSPQVIVEKPTATWAIQTGYVQPWTTAGYFGLLAAPGTGYPGGEYWQSAVITVPAPFSGGSGCFAQLLTPDFEMLQDGSTTPVVGPNNKMQGLDNAFPYPSSQWTLPNTGSQSDRPAFGVAGVNSPQYQGWNTATGNYSFTTWLMYQPTGGVWVPLQSYTWNWSCTVKWLNSQWTITASSPTASSQPTPTVTSTPPTWSLMQNNGSS